MRRWEGTLVKKERDPQLKGAFAAVLLLGFILAASWTAVYLLFINR